MWTCPVPQNRDPNLTREFKDLTFDDAELFPILVGRVCHQNIYDLVQIWKSDEAMHRHESTTLETSNKNAENGTGNVGFVLVFFVEYEEKQQSIGIPWPLHHGTALTDRMRVLVQCIIYFFVL